jgi:hypothetical protein
LPISILLFILKSSSNSFPKETLEKIIIKRNI